MGPVSQNLVYVMGCVMKTIRIVMGAVIERTIMKDIFGLAMGLASHQEINVMGNVLKDTSIVVLVYAYVQTKCNIGKIAMDGALQIGYMKGTTGIAMGHAHQRVFHVMDIATKGMSNVAIHVYFLIK